MNETIRIIAGDDYSFAVDFILDNQPYILQNGDSAEMVIHIRGEEKIIPAKEYRNNTAIFYLSQDDTLSLLSNGRGTTYTYCIRFTWDNGSRTTPLHRERMIIERC